VNADRTGRHNHNRRQSSAGYAVGAIVTHVWIDQRAGCVPARAGSLRQTASTPALREQEERLRARVAGKQWEWGMARLDLIV